MKKIIDKIANNYHLLYYGLFLVVHAVCCVFVNLYGDDYYYAGFTRNGLGYFVSENIFHYKYTNGRALVHLLDELLLSNFWFWRIFNVAALGLLILGIAKIAAGEWVEKSDIFSLRFKRTLTITTAIFSVTDLAVLRQSVYWATGSLNYLVPTAAMLWFYYFFRRDFETMRGSWRLIPAGFFAAATTEQASAAVVLVTLCFIVSSVVVRKIAPKPAYVLSFLGSLAGFCTLYLSPGNAARTQYYPDFYAMPLWKRPLANFKELATVILARGGIYTIVILFLIMVILECAGKVKNEKNSPLRRLISAFVAISAASGTGLYIWTLVTGSDKTIIYLCVLLFVPIISAMIYTAVRYFRIGEIDELYFVWCAVAMQAAMSFSPEFGPRTLLISLCCLIVPVAGRIARLETGRIPLAAVCGCLIFALLPWYVSSYKMLIDVTMVLSIIAIIYNIKKSDFLPKTAMAFTLSLCLAQFSTVAAGYGKNYAVLNEDYRILSDYAKSPTGEITLYVLPNSQYKYTMPYNDKYHERVLLKLYGIDPGTPVNYVEYVLSEQTK